MRVGRFCLRIPLIFPDMLQDAAVNFSSPDWHQKNVESYFVAVMTKLIVRFHSESILFI